MGEEAWADCQTVRSFDPDYPTESIDVFEPMVRRVFAEPRYLPPGWV